jgi:uncharacterized protein YigE (DUF2233 family)
MLKYILPIILPWFSPSGPIPENCQNITYLGTKYSVCSFDPDEDELRLYYQDAQSGAVLRNFTRLTEVLERDGRELVFAMNAGMYHRDMSPVGLYVEGGRELAPLISGAGWGNFHLLPNGVFYLKDRKAAVMEALAYETEGLKPDFATQSGPMLVIDGEVHPKFLPQSDSLKIRNGVGVSADGRVHFAISEQPVRFYDFALLFKDHLKTPNALYFDGTISSMAMPALARFDRSYPMGPMVVVSKQKKSP